MIKNKLLSARVFTYKGINGVETSIRYVLLEDVVSHHGEAFAADWQKFHGNKSTFKIPANDSSHEQDTIQTGYYYTNYEFASHTTMQQQNLGHQE
jgi:hypothetical protein